MNLTEEQKNFLNTLVKVYNEGCHSEFLVVRTSSDGSALLYPCHQNVAINSDDTDFEGLATEKLIHVRRNPRGDLVGKPTALGIETVARWSVDWLASIDQETFLAVYDVLLDIEKEFNILADPIVIPLVPQIIRFTLLFPGDTIGTRDRYAGLRYKAVEFLKKKDSIKDFHLIEGGHRWESRIQVSADESQIRTQIALMKEESSRRSSQRKSAKAVRKEGKARVFIGHGRASLWKDLKDFLQDRLGLEWEEYNHEEVAGYSRKERLGAMLENVDFAFLVLTADDEHKDGTRHARENAIHETGLFQGRLGFEKAIVLLEDGCAEFSNIEGLEQIRFPKANIAAVSERIRKVLEREGIISNPSAS